MRIGVALRTVAGEDAVIYDRTAPTNVHSAAQRSVVAVVAAVGTVAAECAVCNRRAGVIGGHAAAVIVFASRHGEAVEECIRGGCASTHRDD